MMKPFGLPKALRLKTSRDFARVFARKRSVSDEHLVIYGCENDIGQLRLGLAVSRKVGGAVQRNRLRRLYREAFRLTRPELPAGLDLVFVPRSSREPTLLALQETLRRLLPALERKLRREKPT